MAKQIIVGTAGHVDHGKTALIHALTGTNTDRLREEQERGMSIELGFASFTLPSGVHAGIVDVPGHERFLRNMLAGAGGIDLVLLVVAADEGVMPQTVEHLDILQVLQAKSGLVVLTKADLVEPDWLELVKEDLALQLSETFLAEAPILPVSAVTGAGLDRLVSALDERAQAVAPKSSLGAFRLPIDRAFTLAGFGTVVTGTLRSGRLSLGAAAELQPSGVTARVRGLQTHGEKVAEAVAGSRVAVNLSGVELSQVARGDVLAPPGLLAPCHLLDCQLSLLPRLGAPIAHQTRVRVHLGTAEVLARLSLLDRDELGPGETAFVQLSLEEPAAALSGDRYVLRLYSPLVTLGGGVVLDPHAVRHRRRHAPTLERLGLLLTGTPEDRLLQAAREAGLAGLSQKEASSALGLTAREAQELLDRLSEGETAESGVVPPLARLGGRWLHQDALGEGLDRVARVLAGYHREAPLRAGLSREELKSRVAPKLEAKLWIALLEAWSARGELRLTGAVVGLPGHEVAFTPAQSEAAAVLEERYRAAGFDPPAEDAALSALPTGAQPLEVLAALIDQGTLVHIAPGLYLHRDAYDTALAALRELAAAHGSVTVGLMRDAVGSSRKVIVPLMEHFDTLGITRRVGDSRVLIEAGGFGHIE
ncbi:MAG TPA: selenocysteine-specific translation elongation factor [Armatimonadota bacterium]|jgi:selenocysteine-specific elongation factor